MEKEKYLPVECEVVDVTLEGRILASSSEGEGGGGGSI